MPYPDKLLGPEETIVLDLHPHWRTVIRPIVLVPVVAALTGFLLAIGPGGGAQSVYRIVVAVVALLVLVWFTVVPLLRWRTTRYIVTTRRVLLRSGVLSRSGRDIPLSRVNDVSFQHTFVERFFRSGTLTVESAGERGQVTLRDIPEVEEAQRIIYRLAEAAEEERPHEPTV